MGSFAVPGHPLLRHLAIVRLARDFGLQSDELDALSLRLPPASGRADQLAEAASAALLERHQVGYHWSVSGGELPSSSREQSAAATRPRSSPAQGPSLFGRTWTRNPWIREAALSGRSRTVTREQARVSRRA